MGYENTGGFRGRVLGISLGRESYQADLVEQAALRGSAGGPSFPDEPAPRTACGSEPADTTFWRP